MTQEQLLQQQMAQKALGDLGEDFVLRYERERLRSHPLVGSIRIVGRTDVGMGYDILSFQGLTSQQPDRYIEVKTYGKERHFFLSASEQAAAAKYENKYWVYLVDRERVNEVGYQPTMIQDPVRSLSGSQWKERVHSREYVFTEDVALPSDIGSCTVLVGCYRSNEHLSWIRRSHYYNVRSSYINGSVGTDEITEGVRYLLLYDSKAPSIYRCYSVVSTCRASLSEMLRLGYPSPHANQYILYRLQEKVNVPGIDILRILRTYNDKLRRTSGTPIYMPGAVLQGYVMGGPVQGGLSNVRAYTNENKPWSQMQLMKLSAMYTSGTDIALLAHHFKRTPLEVKQQLTAMQLLP